MAKKLIIGGRYADYDEESQLNIQAKCKPSAKQPRLMTWDDVWVDGGIYDGVQSIQLSIQAGDVVCMDVTFYEAKNPKGPLAGPYKFYLEELSIKTSSRERWMQNEIQRKVDNLPYHDLCMTGETEGYAKEYEQQCIDRRNKQKQIDQMEEDLKQAKKELEEI